MQGEHATNSHEKSSVIHGQDFHLGQINGGEMVLFTYYEIFVSLFVQDKYSFIYFGF